MNAPPTDLKLLQKALDAAHSSIVIADMRQKGQPLIYVNKTFQQLTGYTAREVLGKNCRFMQSSDRRQPELARIREALRKKRPLTVQLRNYRKNGSMFWNELRLAPVFDADGTLTHFIGVQSDVSDRVRAEEELRKHRKALESLVAERTRSLEQKTIALKELLGQLEVEKKALEERVTANVDNLLLPLLTRLKRKCGPAAGKGLLALEAALKDLASPLGRTLTRKLYRLTPREIEICHLIRRGFSTKDLSEHLGISISTVENQRNAIRRKLGIGGQDVSLATALQNFLSQETP